LHTAIFPENSKLFHLCTFREAAMNKRIEGSPEVYHTAELQESCRIIEAAAAAAEHYYPLVLTGSQMKLVERAVSLACDDAIEAMRDEPEDCHLEIEPDIDAYNLISALLKLATSSRKGSVGDHWQGDAL
jgi:hypothetical protein